MPVIFATVISNYCDGFVPLVRTEELRCKTLEIRIEECVFVLQV